MYKTSDFKKFGTVPRVHGNGFLQLDLTEDRRLHVWGHPDLPRQKVDTSIHNHRFSFRSEVLVGRLVNATYFEHHVFSGLPTHDFYEPVVREGEDTTLVLKMGRGVWLGEPKLRLVVTGQSYHMHGPVFHESFSDRPSATLMTKTEIHKDVSPRVLVPRGQVPDNAFNRNSAMPVEQMWDIIGQVLG